jgi:uncharacterized protein YhhL (DUF1145 family)
MTTIRSDMVGQRSHVVGGDGPRVAFLVVMAVAWTLAAVLVVLALLAAVANRVPTLDRPARMAALVAEGVLLVYTVVDLVLVLSAAAADRPDSMLTHFGYAVATAGLLPLLVWRQPPEDPDEVVEPASLWVVAIALLAVAVCVVRLAQTR